MRVLNLAERKVISGAGAPVPLTQVAPKIFTNTVNGITTTVVCTAPQSFSFTLALSSIGKLVRGDTGLGATISGDCTITTIDTKTNIESVLHPNGKIDVIDLKNGHTISETDAAPGDTGLSELAGAEGNTSGDEFAGGDSVGGDYGGGGGDFGGGGGGEGGGGGGGDGDGDYPRSEA